MIFFKGSRYPKDAILIAVLFYVSYGVSYRDLEEIMRESDDSVDHTMLNRWATRYFAANAETGPRPQTTMQPLRENG